MASEQLAAVRVLYDPTDLSRRLEAEGSCLVTREWDYGYGGESYEVATGNVDAIMQVVHDWLEYMHAMERFSDHDIARLRGAL